MYLIHKIEFNSFISIQGEKVNYFFCHHTLHYRKDLLYVLTNHSPSQNNSKQWKHEIALNYIDETLLNVEGVPRFESATYWD